MAIERHCKRTKFEFISDSTSSSRVVFCLFNPSFVNFFAGAAAKAESVERASARSFQAFRSPEANKSMHVFSGVE